MLVLLLAWCDCCGAIGATDCIVVRVVVKDLTDGAGEENVLSAPLAELTPHPTV
jgi:hypothetical protein